MINLRVMSHEVPPVPRQERRAHELRQSQTHPPGSHHPGSLHEAWWSSVEAEGQHPDGASTLLDEVQRGEARIGDVLQVLAEQLPQEAESCLDLISKLRSTSEFAAQHLSADAASVFKSHLLSNQELGAKHRVRLRGGSRQGVHPRDAKSSREGQGHDDKNIVQPLQHVGSPRPPDHDGGSDPGNLEAGDFLRKANPKGLPFLPDQSHGNLRQRCFVLFDDASASICGKIIEIIVIATISISTIAFAMESMPEFRQTPAPCWELQAAGLPLTVEACEPVALPWFRYLEVVCIVIFTIDYVCRVGTIHSVPAAQLSSSRTSNWEDPEVMHPPRKPTCSEGLRRTFDYARQPMAVVDFLAIAPFYIDLVTAAFGIDSILGPAAGILRLMRVLRLLKLARGHKGIQMYAEVLKMSGQPIAILMFFNSIIVVLFGTLMYYAEGTTFSVHDRWTKPLVMMQADGTNITKVPPHPTGVHVHLNSFGTELISPFTSIPRALWWVCVTMTTVGYGDFTPVTSIGKMIGIVCFYIGVVFLALPISVLGRNFDIVYNRMLVQQAKEDAMSPRRSIQSPVRRRTRKPGSATMSLEVKMLPQQSNIRQQIFLLLEDPTASVLGKYISLLMIIVILISTASFLMESMPSFRETPASCSPPEVLTVKDCKPVPIEVFSIVEKTCIIIFTIDYLGRMLTVDSCTSMMFGFDDENPGKTGWRLTLAYMRQPINLIDLFAIAPFYVDAVGLMKGGGTGVLRVLRLVRVFRVLKMPKLRSCAEMFIDVAFDAMPALAILLFMTTLACMFFASCMYFAEGTHYTVDQYPADRTIEDRPTGLYIRPTKQGYGIEESPFRSIPYTFWWFFTTATTVGYGDDFPTTTLGRFVAVAVFCAGIILLAMPITIVGGSFTKFYSSWVAEFGDDSQKDEDERSERYSDRHGTKDSFKSEGSGPEKCAPEPEQCTPMGEITSKEPSAKVAWS